MDLMGFYACVNMAKKHACCHIGVAVTVYKEECVCVSLFLYPAGDWIHTNSCGVMSQWGPKLKIHIGKRANNTEWVLLFFERKTSGRFLWGVVLG